MVKSDSLGKILFGLIIGGAVGNLFDRFTYFAVPDFIDFHINSFHWFTFNVADIFISIGVIGLIISELLKKNAYKYINFKMSLYIRKRADASSK